MMVKVSTNIMVKIKEPDDYVQLLAAVNPHIHETYVPYGSLDPIGQR